MKVDNMKQVQRGFTLIELVMVIVILGVLAAVALPKFVDLKSDAQQAAMNGVAGAAASASAINYAGCSISSAASSPAKWGRVCGARRTFVTMTSSDRVVHGAVVADAH